MPRAEFYVSAPYDADHWWVRSRRDLVLLQVRQAVHELDISARFLRQLVFGCGTGFNLLVCSSVGRCGARLAALRGQPRVSCREHTDGFRERLGVTPTRLLHRLAACAPLFHYGQLPFYWGVTPQLERALDLHPGERVLDIGCGTGIAAAAARGPYVGIDVDVPCVRFAHAHWPRATCTFAIMSALDLGFCDAAFNKAMLINTAHHLSDTVLDRLFEQLTRIVRTRVLVLDMDPGFANAVSRFLLDRDRGEHLRQRTALRPFSTRHYAIESEAAFYNLTRTVPQVLFSLVPKRAQAAAS